MDAPTHPIAFDTLKRIAGRHFDKRHTRPANDRDYWQRMSDALDYEIVFVDRVRS